MNTLVWKPIKISWWLFISFKITAKVALLSPKLYFTVPWFESCGRRNFEARKVWINLKVDNRKQALVFYFLESICFITSKIVQYFLKEFKQIFIFSDILQYFQRKIIDSVYSSTVRVLKGIFTLDFTGISQKIFRYSVF